MEKTDLKLSAGASVEAQLQNELNDSYIVVRNMNEYVREGLQMDPPEELIENVIVKQETTILFGDTGLGKTTLAMQYAIRMAAERHRVLYVNFELSQQQMSHKYPEVVIPQDLFIATIDYSRMHEVTEQAGIIGEIEKTALMYDCTVIIIDNLTNLCIDSKESSEAGRLMLKLISLRQTHAWTMLILAHVPKRKQSEPLTLNDLAGSKLLSNIADNVIGLNRSKQGSNKRYIIQLKYRSKPIFLDEKNVQELNLEMTGGYLHFTYGERSEEKDHLPRSRDENAELEQEIILELTSANGKSYREIADQLKTNITRISRVAQALGLNKPRKQS